MEDKLTQAETAAMEQLKNEAARLPGTLGSELIDLTLDWVGRTREPLRELDPEISEEQHVWVVSNLIQQLNNWLDSALEEPLLKAMPGVDPDAPMPQERVTGWMSTILRVCEADPASPAAILPSLYAPYGTREDPAKMLRYDFADSVSQRQSVLHEEQTDALGETAGEAGQSYGAYLTANFPGQEEASRFVLEQWYVVNRFEELLSEKLEAENASQAGPLRPVAQEQEPASEPSAADLTALEEAATLEKSALLEQEDDWDQAEDELLETVAETEAANEARHENGKLILEETFSEALESSVTEMPDLLSGPAPVHLIDWLRALPDERIAEIAEVMSLSTIDGSEWPPDRDVLAVRLPADYESYLQVLPLQDLTLRLLLARTSGQLLPYNIILSCQSELTSGIFYLIKRDAGYRLYVPEEIQAVLMPYMDGRTLLRHDLGLSAQEVARALVNRNGLARLETVYESVNQIFAEASAAFEYGELRRVIRQVLESTGKRWDSIYRVERPYVYCRVMDDVTLEDLSEIEAETQRAPEPLDGRTLRQGQTPPFMDPNNEDWRRLLELTADERADMDLDRETAFLYDLAYAGAMELTVDDFVSLLDDYGIAEQQSNRRRQLGRTFVDFQNSCPCWRLGGRSRNETGQAWTYEEAMDFAEGKMPIHDHGHHHHNGHDHHHGHDHQHN